MLKVGDKVICIHNEDRYIKKFNIKKHDSYVIKKLSSTAKFITLEGCGDWFFEYDHFISLSQYRKLKLKKICSKLEIE